jgi:hypothetical protein
MFLAAENLSSYSALKKIAITDQSILFISAIELSQTHLDQKLLRVHGATSSPY